ncbi:hypothetical protein [Flavisericum labens]|uniref:hypothetical protein n=1 Tax=Flavisericum labens TaxID=3377112 RepID=UPI00387B5955
MQAKVDGELIVCDSRVDIIRGGLGSGGGFFGIEGYTDDNIGFYLIFPIAQGVGNYQFLSFSGSIQNEGWYKTGDVNIQYKSTDGSVIVTEDTGSRFKGTFAFTAEHDGDLKIVSEGVFEIDY